MSEELKPCPCCGGSSPAFNDDAVCEAMEKLDPFWNAYGRSRWEAVTLALRVVRAMIAARPQAPAPQPAAVPLTDEQAGSPEPSWRDHVEQRIRSWRQRTMNKSGDMLAIDDFMGQESIDDLVDYVCDEWADAAPALAASSALPQQGRHIIPFDGFEGDVIGGYVTREGKRGVVLQQVGTRVVHVYGEKWLSESGQAAAPPAELLACGHPASLMLKSVETGDDLYCELCDAISRARDAETIEAELRDTTAKLNDALAALAARPHDALEALRELVALESIRERYSRVRPDSPRHPRWEEYLRDVDRYPERYDAAWDRARAVIAAADAGEQKQMIECHGLDTPDRVFFYEQDFYVLSNFSAFTLHWRGRRWDTSEAAYHSEKFPDNPDLYDLIRDVHSAHEAFKIAEVNKHLRRPDWDDVKVDIMRDILRAKADQHEYVRRKLLATGDRELIENSWRDDFWGWGPNRDGKNMLGRLWMEIRAELRTAAADAEAK